MSGRRQQPEAAIQRAIFQHIRARGAGGLVAFHVPNGGARRPREAAILKGLGVVAGAADVILLHRGHAFALELKATDGRPTPAQMQFISDWRAAGGEGCIATGLDVLERWGVLRGVSQ